MNWLSKRFTFVVISDANSSVRHYHISRFILLLIPTIVAFLTVSAFLFFSLFSKHTAITDQLKAELTASTDLYEQQLTEKEVNITTMQADLLHLSEQAKLMEQKMVEIYDLDAQLKQLVGIDEGISVARTSVVTEEGGQGGEEFLIRDEAPNSLVTETKKSYSDIHLQMDELKPHLEETKQAVIKYQALLEITPTIWPTDSRKVTSLFGARKDPFTKRSTYHSGLDIGGDRGDPIYAAADGIVTLSDRDRIHGNNISIDHGRGLQTRYLHLSKRLVDVGVTVKKGQIIGELGNTGRSTGPHLHYEVSVNGVDVDPWTYMKSNRKEP